MKWQPCHVYKWDKNRSGSSVTLRMHPYGFQVGSQPQSNAGDLGSRYLGSLNGLKDTSHAESWKWELISGLWILWVYCRHTGLSATQQHCCLVAQIRMILISFYIHYYSILRQWVGTGLWPFSDTFEIFEDCYHIKCNHLVCQDTHNCLHRIKITVPGWSF